MFIVMSFSFGTAIFLLTLLALYHGTGRTLGDVVVARLRNLLGIFVMAVLYFVLAYNITNLYATEHHAWEQFLLRDGGVYPLLFWGVQILLGSLLPLALFYLPACRRRRACTALGAILVIIGGLTQVYVVIIGAQAFPLVMFPGMEVHSSFFDGVVAHYSPSLPEIGLGVGGTAFALLATLLALKVLPFTPQSLADADLPDTTRSAASIATPDAAQT
jgi:molybdopterin-containing oxidoreductase family membrane subunit